VSDKGSMQVLLRTQPRESCLSGLVERTGFGQHMVWSRHANKALPLPFPFTCRCLQSSPVCFSAQDATTGSHWAGPRRTLRLVLISAESSC
jgi:hypothetical protein